MNRAVLRAAHLREHVEEIEHLHRPMKFNDRIELWLRTFTGQPISALNESVAWSHLQELRQARNGLMHATVPQFGVEIRELERQLNLVRAGVGELLVKLRALQGLAPTTFSERLATAPKVQFCK